MKHKLTMRYPSAWHREMWREGVPMGNGLVGGMVCLRSGVPKKVVQTLGEGYTFADGSTLCQKNIQKELKIEFCKTTLSTL